MIVLTKLNLSLWQNDDAIGGILEAFGVSIIRIVLGQTGIIGVIGTGLNATAGLAQFCESWTNTMRLTLIGK